MKSIKTKMIVMMGILLSAMCIGLGLISYFNATNVLIEQVNDSLEELVKLGAGKVSAQIQSRFNSLDAIAGLEVMRGSSITEDIQANAILQKEVKRNAYLEMGIARQDGVVIGSDISIKDSDFFQAALEGKEYVSDPVVTKETKEVKVYYAVPIKDENEHRGEWSIRLINQEFNLIYYIVQYVKVI